MKEDSDRYLVKRAQCGDTRAYGELVQKYQKRIYEIAYNFTHHPEDAYDLSQEIFLQRLQGAESF